MEPLKHVKCTGPHDFEVWYCHLYQFANEQGVWKYADPDQPDTLELPEEPTLESVTEQEVAKRAQKYAQDCAERDLRIEQAKQEQLKRVNAQRFDRALSSLGASHLSSSNNPFQDTPNTTPGSGTPTPKPEDIPEVALPPPLTKEELTELFKAAQERYKSNKKSIADARAKCAHVSAWIRKSVDRRIMDATLIEIHQMGRTDLKAQISVLRRDFTPSAFCDNYIGVVPALRSARTGAYPALDHVSLPGASRSIPTKSNRRRRNRQRAREPL
ncbi:hypothetical protein F5Y05DRAFT_410888 [Hypoxylon sp. FL0543]|nr:hypothetical protein F5Y05DRAFT_410888 [Hypoxylon sp. FL0543]